MLEVLLVGVVLNKTITTLCLCLSYIGVHIHG